jgi:hypothetical protein
MPRSISSQVQRARPTSRLKGMITGQRDGGAWMIRGAQGAAPGAGGAARCSIGFLTAVTPAMRPVVARLDLAMHRQQDAPIPNQLFGPWQDRDSLV